MPSLYLTDKGSSLGIDGECFKILADNLVRTIPIIKIDSVIVFGSCNISTNAIDILLQEQIPTTFLSNNGRYYGRLVSTEEKNIELRMMQIDKYKDDQFRLNFSKEIIKGKLLNSVYILKNLNRNNKQDRVVEIIEDIYKILSNLEKADSFDSVRGYEGSSSVKYFEAMRLLLKENFGFVNRNRRPPKDPINSMLSFLYTLLMYQVYTAVNITGLDVAVGFFHEYKNHRPALALDLMEEFRALIADQVIFDMVNHNMVSSSDFHNDDNEKYAVLINNDLRKKIIKKFETRISTPIMYNGENISYRRLLEYKARELVRSIKSDNMHYQAFVQK
jgi:CRISP-associated protein Cas1